MEGDGTGTSSKSHGDCLLRRADSADRRSLFGGSARCHGWCNTCSGVTCLSVGGPCAFAQTSPCDLCARAARRRAGAAVRRDGAAASAWCARSSWASAIPTTAPSSGAPTTAARSGARTASGRRPMGFTAATTTPATCGSWPRRARPRSTWTAIWSAPWMTSTAGRSDCGFSLASTRSSSTSKATAASGRRCCSGPARPTRSARPSRRSRPGEDAGRAAHTGARRGDAGARARVSTAARPRDIRRRRPHAPARTPQRGFGTLSIRVQPADAVVVVDGERWDRPDGDPRLSVELSAGAHQVEVRKDGHKPYVSNVQVRSGEVTTLNVSLPVEP